MDEKVLIALISASVGWALAQGTALAKERWNIWKLKKGLFYELQDIKDQMQRVVMLYARQLQIYALNGMEPAAALPIHNFFFKHYYKDVLSSLNREQRISYQLIHATLDGLNKKSEDFAKFTEDLYKNLKGATDQATIGKAVELWGDRVVSLYKTSMDVLWHLEYHLKHANRPSYEVTGPIHESFLKYEEELDQEVKTIIEKAKSMKRENF
jgi:hypothetical protein